MSSDAEPGPAKSTKRGTVLLLCLLAAVVLGLGLRTWSAPAVFTQDRIYFYGTDPWYHVHRAERIAAGDWDRAWHDPDMNFPEGARVPWPPLFDLLMAAAALLLEKLSILSSALGPVAALISPLLGAATAAVLAALAWRFYGPGVAVVAAFLLAVMPVHLDYTRVGRPDQHSAEALLSCLAFLFFLSGATARSRVGRIASSGLFGLTVALACWTWMGAIVYLFLPVLCLAALWLLEGGRQPQATRRCAVAVATGGGVAALLLTLSLFLWGPEGALQTVDLLGLSAFHVLLAALAAALGSLLAGACGAPLTRSSPARAWVLALSASVPAAVLSLAVPGFRESVGTGIEIFGEDNPWFHTISEFQPLFFQEYQTLGQELLVALETYGLGLLLMPVAGIALILDWRRQPEKRTTLAFSLAWGLVFLAATLLRKRFGYYLAAPLSLWLAYGWGWSATFLATRGVSKRWARAVPAVALLVLLSPAALGIRDVLAPDPEWRQELFSTLDWLRDQEQVPGREATLADWDFGHYVQAIARKPVVVNPFGTHLGPTPMRDAALFFLADRPGPALEVLHRRRVGYLLLNDPIHYFGLAPFLPGAGASGQGHVRGEPPPLNRLLVTQLYYLDRLVARPEEPALDLGFRLLYESSTEKTWRQWTGRRYKVFGVVPGATLVVRAAPGRQVMAGIRVTTNQDRSFLWTERATAGEGGEARLTLPYSCGRNGAVVAPGPYEVTDGSRTETLVTTPEQVEAGAVVHLTLE